MVIRPAVLAGTWYPAAAAELVQELDRFLAIENKDTRLAGRPQLAVTPHAGYAYSGPTAGPLFRQLAGHRVRTVLLLAPNHRLPLDRIALSGADAFATPLGRVSLNTEAVSRLGAALPFAVNDAAHAQEHAVEIVLPFLQRIWPEPHTPAIVPLLVPHLSREDLALAGRELAALKQDLGPDTLVLVSSDFTHYGGAFGFQPFTQDVPAELEKLDAGAILRLLAGKAEDLLDYGRETGITMCGLPAAAVALFSGLPPDFEADLLAYNRSGDRDHDYSHSVSYASLLFTDGVTAGKAGGQEDS